MKLDFIFRYQNNMSENIIYSKTNVPPNDKGVYI